MEEFYGKHYQMVDTENFEQLLIFLEIGFFRRRMALTLRPVQFIEKNEDGTYSLHFQCALLKYQLDFTPGKEFDETKPDGTQVRAFIRIEGNKIFHRQVESNGRTLNHEYEFHPDKMTLTTTAPGLEHIVKRHYVAVKGKDDNN